MILCDQDIRNELNRGALKIEPIDPENIQPASVDLTLDNQFAAIAGYEPIYPDKSRAPSLLARDGYYRSTVPDGKYYALPPRGFVLASTVQRVRIPDHLCGEVRDKSSVARLGLSLLPAGYIDPGFQGHITLEIVNHTQHTWMLKPGMLICQLLLVAMYNRPFKPYGDAHGSRYQDSPRGPVASRIYEGN